MPDGALDVIEDVDGNVCVGLGVIPRFPWGWTETRLGYPDALGHLTQEDLRDTLLEALEGTSVRREPPALR